MKVLVVVSGPAQGSGVRSASVALTDVLESLGHSVDTLAIDTGRRSQANQLNFENLRSGLRDLAAVVRAVRRNRPAIVWFHSLGFPLLPGLRTLAVVLLARLLRVPVISHLHAYGLDQSALTRHRWSRWVVSAVGHTSETLIVLHETSAQAVRSIVPPDRVAVLPNIVDVPPEPAPLPLGDRRRLVFVGGLVRRKGVPELLEAMRLLDDSYELHLVGGPGEDGQGATAQLIESASDLVARGRVVFEGELGDPGVRDQLRRADLFVLPSHAEGTPIALLEAIGEGRPVLVSNAGNMADVVSESGCGEVLTSVQPMVIAAALRRMLGDPDLLVSQASVAWNVAITSYAPDAIRSTAHALLGERT